MIHVHVSLLHYWQNQIQSFTNSSIVLRAWLVPDIGIQDNKRGFHSYKTSLAAEREREGALRWMKASEGRRQVYSKTMALSWSCGPGVCFAMFHKTKFSCHCWACRNHLCLKRIHQQAKEKRGGSGDKNTNHCKFLVTNRWERTVASVCCENESSFCGSRAQVPTSHCTRIWWEWHAGCRRLGCRQWKVVKPQLAALAFIAK